MLALQINQVSLDTYRPDPHQLTKEGYYNDNLMWKYQKYTLNSSATTEWDSFMNEEGFLLFFLLCSTFKENTVTQLDVIRVVIFFSHDYNLP